MLSKVWLRFFAVALIWSYFLSLDCLCPKSICRPTTREQVIAEIILSSNLVESQRKLRIEIGKTDSVHHCYRWTFHFFQTKSVKQIFDISTNINDDYKIIDVHFKKFIGCTWTRNCSGKNCIVTLIGTSIIINSLWTISVKFLISWTVGMSALHHPFPSDKLPGNDY